MKAYTIESKTGIKAVILPEKGATAISLQKEGREFLYCDEENLESPERPRCGIPFLFPIFGRLKEGKYTWKGKDYAMEIHGFGHTSSWQVAEYTGYTEADTGGQRSKPQPISLPVPGDSEIHCW